jgi:hypothetical protein
MAGMMAPLPPGLCPTGHGPRKHEAAVPGLAAHAQAELPLRLLGASGLAPTLSGRPKVLITPLPQAHAGHTGAAIRELAADLRHGARPGMHDRLSIFPFTPS